MVVAGLPKIGATTAQGFFCLQGVDVAKRRMFSNDIIDTDRFLEMPSSTQLLYFHLAMRADDDGFINNPMRIMRMTGLNEDDLKLLIVKEFVIPFESGVCVIKHWRVHNYIQKDRYNKTFYQEEFLKLQLGENNVYTLDTECIQNGYTGKVRLESGKSKDNIPPFIPPEGGEPPKSRGKNNKVTDQEADDIISTITEKDYQDSLKLFVVHRREIRKPMTANALKQTIKLLEQIPKVDDRIKCVELSIANGWQGVFPDKFTEAQPARQQKTRTGPEPDLKGDDSWMRKVRNHGKQD